MSTHDASTPTGAAPVLRALVSPDAAVRLAEVVTDEDLLDWASDLDSLLLGVSADAAAHAVLEALRTLASEGQEDDSPSAVAVKVVLRPATAALRARGFPPEEAEVRATALIAGVRGVCHDLRATGERRRAEQTLNLLIAAVNTEPTSSPAASAASAPPAAPATPGRDLEQG